MNVYSELNDLNLMELIGRFHGPPPDGEEYAATYYDAIATQIRAQGEPGIAFLLAERERAEADEARLRGVLLGLSLPPPVPSHPQIRDILRSYLKDRRPLVEMEAIDGLWSQGDTDIRDSIAALSNHSSPYVRGSVLRYLQHLYPSEAVSMALATLKDPSHIVRDCAINALDELGEVDALPAIRPLLSDPHPSVRQAAETAIRYLEELQDRDVDPRSSN